MIDCLVLGDSIAVGVGQARPACVTLAQVGITSSAYLQTVLPHAPRSAAQLVISLGVNDDPTVPTLENLRVLRTGVHAFEVIWLLPGLKDAVRQMITLVARENNDRIVDTVSQVGPDHLHPSRDGYRLIASWTLPGHGALPARAQSLAMLGMMPTPRMRSATIEPNAFGNLAQYRAMPVVVYPNSFNSHVRYGVPGVSWFRANP